MKEQGSLDPDHFMCNVTNTRIKMSKINKNNKMRKRDPSALPVKSPHLWPKVNLLHKKTRKQTDRKQTKTPAKTSKQQQYWTNAWPCVVQSRQGRRSSGQWTLTTASAPEGWSRGRSAQHGYHLETRPPGGFGRFSAQSSATGKYSWPWQLHW